MGLITVFLMQQKPNCRQKWKNVNRQDFSQTADQQLEELLNKNADETVKSLSQVSIQMNQVSSELSSVRQTLLEAQLEANELRGKEKEPIV